MRHARIIAGITLIMLTAACGSSPPPKPPYAGIKIGKPYEIYGRWYEPKYNAHYDEIGMASWYGPGFHGGKTASGDRFDQDEMTAAHRTLPLPSIVRVTNLDNGESALVKVNDRGPFSHDRIIDLSRAAAKKLGVWRTGTAKVRVQFLDAETREYVKNLQKGNSVEYAMDQVSQTNPEEAIARQEAGEKPQLEIGSRMFGDDTSPDIAASDSAVTPALITPNPPETYSPPATLTTVPTYPDPPHVNVLREPAARPQPPLQPLPPPAYPASVAKQDMPHYNADPFSVVDNSPAPVAATYGLTSPSSGGLFIQAGTFGNEQNAQKLSGRLASLGGARVTQITLSGRKFYRVTLGPYNAQPDAKNMLSKVAALGIPDARITRN